MNEKHQAILAIVLSALSFAGGRVTTRSTPHSEECSPEISQNRVLEDQLAVAERVTLDRVLDATQACKEAELRICQGKIEAFKVSYRQLKCSICAGADQ